MWGRVPAALAEAVSVATPNVRPGHTPLPLSFEANRLARLAPSSAVLRANNTTLLATVTEAPDAVQRPSLVVDFRTKAAAVGVIPATWTRREAQPALAETLTARLIDRSLRPVISAAATASAIPPLHVCVSVLSASRLPDAPVDALAVNAAAAALVAHDDALALPIAAARVARVRSHFVPFPDHAAAAEADLSVFTAIAPQGNVLALSLQASHGAVPDDEIMEAVHAATEAAAAIFPVMSEFRTAVRDLRLRDGRSAFPPQPPPRTPPSPAPIDTPAHVVDSVSAAAFDAYCDAFVACRELPGKAHRAAVLTHVQEKLCTAFNSLPSDVLQPILHRTAKKAFRFVTLRDACRIDGRAFDAVRPVRLQTSVLPGDVHGSALFERGDTQVLAHATIGLRHQARKTEEYVERTESVLASGSRFSDDFFVHYSFPPFATGETGRYAAAMNRREVGHSELISRSVAPVLGSGAKDGDDFPYATRVAAETLGSDGSSSMASVCAAAVALMDCGVPVREPVAGVAMGLLSPERTPGKDGDDDVAEPEFIERASVLTDILGAEDHFGEMDMKVAGTKSGVTACQLDTKRATGLPVAIIARALHESVAARGTIIDRMVECGLPSRRAGVLPDCAPRIERVRADGSHAAKTLLRDRAALLRSIEESCNVRAAVNHREHYVEIEAPNVAAATKARQMIEQALQDVEVGTTMNGKVVEVRSNAAVVDIGAGINGVLHVSRMQVSGGGGSAASYPDVRRVFDKGDPVEVVVVESDVRRRILRFGLVGRPQRAGEKLADEIDSVLASARSSKKVMA